MMIPGGPQSTNEPVMPELDTPQGFGEANPPPGGVFAAEATVLIQAADAWDAVSEQLSSAWSEVQEGWDLPFLFGFQDTLYTSGRFHADINQVLTNACADGATITAGLADGLVETANSFSGTDSTQGENFRPLEDRAGA